MKKLKIQNQKLKIGNQKSKIRPFSTVRPIKHSMGLSLIYGCSPFGVYPYPLDRHSVVPSPTKRNTPKAGHLKTKLLEKWNKFVRVWTGAKKKLL